MTNTRKTSLMLLCLLAIASFAPIAAQAQSDDSGDKILVRSENRPLVSLQQKADQASDRRVPLQSPRVVPNFSIDGLPNANDDKQPVEDGVADAIVQDAFGEQLTAVGSGFYGASNNDNAALVGFMIAPPDTDGQVGRDHFVQMINLLTTIFDKSGNIIAGPFTSDLFWTGIGGNCEPNNQGDPVVLYDDIADRWLVSQFAFPDSMTSYSQCVAISQTGDPTGGWNRYEFSFNSYGFNDYPKHGIVSDSITMMANLFLQRRGNFFYWGTFLGVMDKAAMYAGQSASLIGYNIGRSEGGFVAGDLDGPGSAPALFATAMSNSNRFDIWEVEVDWTTETASVGQIASVPITPFDSVLCGASRGACIPQPQGGPALESLSDRLMHRLQIRDFGSHRTMVTSHTVNAGAGRAGIRWYEMRETGGTWALYQEGTYAPDDGEYRWMPSAAMNAAGDIGIGFLLASTNTFVSTAVVGQTFGASGTGLLDSEELICAPGGGVQKDAARSGDYSSTSIDPIDDSFWHTNEVFTDTGNFQWNTFVCEFVVANNGGGNAPPVASFTSICTDLDCDFTDTSTDSDGTVDAWSWDFGDGTFSGLQNPSHSFGSDGTYSVSLVAFDNNGAFDGIANDVTVEEGVSNIPPTAAFTSSCTDLECDFTDTSTDSDGSIVAWNWVFGDGTVSNLQNPPTKIYPGEGVYDVTFTVTDNDGDDDTTSQEVVVSDPSGGDPIEVFNDSFENGEWNGLWTENAQNDWFASAQRATSGNSSAEVDGRALDAALISIPIDLQNRTSATVTFNWLIERGLDAGEYLAFDVSTDGGSSWVQKADLKGDLDSENSWQAVQVDLDGINSLRLRFRGRMNSPREDANLDEVVVIAK